MTLAPAETATQALDPDTGPPHGEPPPALGLGALAALAAVLPACGGGGAGADPLAASADELAGIQAVGDGSAPVSPPVRPPVRLTREQASRFLSQASLGATAQDIAQLRSVGIQAWLSAQFSAPRGASYVDLISPGGPDADVVEGNSGGANAVERALWRKLITSPDVLRQRVSLALSEIFVVSIKGVALNSRGFSVAAFMDILEGNAFGNYRDLLMQVSTSSAMGAYLSFVNNRKANPRTGSQPDENYAREVMQLFSIGLLKLNLDGTPVLVNGEPQESYTQADVLGMARVFTGWALSADRSTPYTIVTQPMRQVPGNHELGTKEFLGTTIPAGTDGVASLGLAVDALMAHPNIGPFVGRQLIQRLVKSNPSPAYVARVATAFNGNAQRQKGDMQATLRAVLLDSEARSVTGLSDPLHGKLREPMLRFLQWARMVRLPPAATGRYGLGDLSDPANALAQSPLRSPSVFNFFRPGYVQPDSELGRRGITAPEFQITNESSVAGYLNFMQRVIAQGLAGSRPDYTDLLLLAGDSAALLAELNVLLAGGQIAAATLVALKTALDSIDSRTAAGALRRVQAAVTLVMAAPEYLVQK
ncbi:hypothetical protein BurJ1DRAFT_3403 [Burkholderiales bacterium JOSHI_001]|nr:hypothetical protein BurJ1DRAFT_3403 [Burkholderiales bacterium JOSHI_001]